MTIKFLQIVIYTTLLVFSLLSFAVAFLEVRRHRRRWFHHVLGAPALLGLVSLLLAAVVYRFFDNASALLFTKGISALLVMLYAVYATFQEPVSKREEGERRITLRGVLGVLFLAVTAICGFGAEAVSNAQQDEEKKVAEEKVKGLFSGLSELGHTMTAEQQHVLAQFYITVEKERADHARAMAEKEAVLQARDMVIQEKDTAFFRTLADKDAVVKSKDDALAVLQREKDAVVKSKDDALTALQREKDAVVKSKDDALAALQREKDAAVKSKDDALASLQREKDAALKSKDDAYLASLREHDAATKQKDDAFLASLRERDAAIKQKDAALLACERKAAAGPVCPPTVPSAAPSPTPSPSAPRP